MGCGCLEDQLQFVTQKETSQEIHSLEYPRVPVSDVLSWVAKPIRTKSSSEHRAEKQANNTNNEALSLFSFSEEVLSPSLEN